MREYGILLKSKLNQMTRCSIDQVIVLMELLYTIDNACSAKVLLDFQVLQATSIA